VEVEPSAVQARIVGVAAIVAALVLGFGLGDAALIDPDEGRNAKIAQEMAAEGELLLPHLNHLPFLDKPFLYFFLSATSVRALGESELAVRLPSLLATWGSLALTFWLALRLAGAAVARVAALVFATTPLALAMARAVLFDSTLAFFVLAAIAAFHRALEPEAAPGDRRRALAWSAAGWLAIALGLLTKGPIALLLVLLVVLPYAFWRRRARVLFRLPGPLVFLAVAGAWAAAVEARFPGFLHYGLVTETWNRLTTDELDRSGPVWYFLPVLVGALFPWSWIAAAGLRGLLARTAPPERRAAVWFLLFWIGAPFVFFSLSQSKRPQYLLPVVPAVAILAAWALVEPAARRLALRVGVAGWMFVALLTAALAAYAGSARAPERLVRLAPVAAVGALAVAAAAGALLALRLRRTPALAPLALALPLVVLPLVTAPLHGRIAEERSGRALAAALAARSEAGTEVLGIETFSPSAAFDLDVPWIVVSADGVALRSNSIERFYESLSAAPDSTLRPKEFWRGALASCPRPYLFVVKPQYAAERAEFARANLPCFYESARYVACGPCRPGGGAGPGGTLR
jgi:4-amino-4-deoxy-L-arabinose transferase-like glycosyltransferase